MTSIDVDPVVTVVWEDGILDRRNAEDPRAVDHLAKSMHKYGQKNPTLGRRMVNGQIQIVVWALRRLAAQRESLRLQVYLHDRLTDKDARLIQAQDALYSSPGSEAKLLYRLWLSGDYETDLQLAVAIDLPVSLVSKLLDATDAR